MKRALSLILILVLCLGLCACGNGKQENKKAEIDYANHPLLTKLYGKWERANPNMETPEPVPFEVLTINEDKTCMMDGVEATWDFGGKWGDATTALEIGIFVNGERVCGALLDDEGLQAVGETHAIPEAMYMNRESNPLVFYDEAEGCSIIRENRIGEIAEEVELTTENWMDYICVRSYTDVTTEKDAFGEVVSTQSSVEYILGGKQDKFYNFDGFVIELKNKETGELTVYSGKDGNRIEVAEDFRLEQYECTRIKGTIRLIDVPEEAITVNQYGDRVFYVGYPSELLYGPPHCFYEVGSGSCLIDGPFFMFF